MYATGFTLRGQNAFGSVMYQMAVRLGDQRWLIGEPAHIRLGIYLYQEAETCDTKKFDLAALIAQTDFITVRSTSTHIRQSSRCVEEQEAVTRWVDGWDGPELAGWKSGRVG